MTPCTRYPDDDPLLRYVSGDMAESELSAVEDHLFSCDSCLARVERYQATQEALAGRVLPMSPAIVASEAGSGPTPPARVGWPILAAIAAALVLGLAAVVLSPRAGADPSRPVRSATHVAPAEAAYRTAPALVRSDAPHHGASDAAAPSLQVAVLAMVAPPPYLPAKPREGGARHVRAFAEGMAAYTRNDWTNAARSLRNVDAPQARFYLAIADLMRGDTAAAETSLEAARASGMQPFARESLFYLGKAALQRGDVETARAWFTAARDAGAGPGQEAERLLGELTELRNR